MTGRLEGKIALVTGSGSGIGRETALAFSREGATVAVADISEEGGNETVRLIRDAGGKASFIKVDITKADQVEAMINTVVETYARLRRAVSDLMLDKLILQEASRGNF